MKNKSHLITIFIIAGTISLFIFLTCIYSGISKIQTNLVDVGRDNDSLRTEFINEKKEIKKINNLLRYHQSEDSMMFEKVGTITKINAQSIDSNVKSISKLTKSKK